MVSFGSRWNIQPEECSGNCDAGSIIPLSQRKWGGVLQPQHRFYRGVDLRAKSMRTCLVKQEAHTFATLDGYVWVMT